MLNLRDRILPPLSTLLMLGLTAGCELSFGPCCVGSCTDLVIDKQLGKIMLEAGRHQTINPDSLWHLEEACSQRKGHPLVEAVHTADTSVVIAEYVRYASTFILVAAAPGETEVTIEAAYSDEQRVEVEYRFRVHVME